MSHDVAAIRGSPYWMSPEHIRGVGCGRKADVWSLGVTLFCIVAGFMPWVKACALAAPCYRHVTKLLGTGENPSMVHAIFGHYRLYGHMRWSAVCAATP